MAVVNVRRLAAIDMYGLRGTERRRRLILAEFIFGAVAVVAFGVWFIAAADRPADRLVGIVIIGVGLNYVPLTLYAIGLLRPGALDAELAGVDTGREIRRYGLLQVWILVPLSLVVLATREAAGDRRRG